MISVVLPVYNGEKSVASSVESVLVQKQTWPHLELIIVNDGSTDKTAEKLQSFASLPGVRLLEQANKGLPRALNAGFAMAKGSFLSWTSADNLYLPGALFQLASFLLEHPEVALSYANMELIGPKGERLEHSSFRPQEAWKDTRRLTCAANSLIEGGDNHIGACFLYRRHLAEIAGSFIPELLGAEDYHFWLKLSRFGKISHINDASPLYRYRLHPESLTSTLDSNTLRLKTLDLARAEKKGRVMDSLEAFLGSGVEEALVRTLSAHCRKMHLTLRHSPKSDLPKGISLEEGEIRLVANRSSNLTLKPIDYQPKHHGHRKLAQPAFLVTGKNTKTFPVLLPPAIPQVWKRACDSAYGAIQPAPQSKASLLMFLPRHISEWTEQVIENILTEDYSLTLLCSSESERQLATAIHQQYPGHSNLRILDLSVEYAQEEGVLECESPWKMALTYALSSVDAIVFAASGTLRLSEMQTIHIEASIAATAGCPLFVIHKDLEQYPAVIHLAHFFRTSPHVELSDRLPDQFVVPKTQLERYLQAVNVVPYLKGLLQGSSEDYSE